LWLRLQREWLQERSNIFGCNHKLLLKKWAAFRYQPGKHKFNCDVTISSSLATVSFEEMKEEAIYDDNERNNNEENKVFFPYYRTINGVLTSNNGISRS